MDPHNDKEFCNRKVADYWGQVDLYIGGTEHAVGHLLYSRMWTKVLFDLGYIGFDEPYKRLVNQGKIQGVSTLVKMIVKDPKEKSYLMVPPETLAIDGAELMKFYIPVEYVEIYNGKYILSNENLKKFQATRPQSLLAKAEIANLKNLESSEELAFIVKESIVNNLQNGFVFLETLVEKMSKSKFNVVNPDDLINKYGADTFRMYEMFLGPVDQDKPWDTKGIEGVHRFLKKLWRLFYITEEASGNTRKVWNEEKATPVELKVLHKTIKKIEEDTERFSFNTAVSAFMVCVNELTDLKCNKKEILEPLLILLTPYAPHVCEELWHRIENVSSILDANYPTVEEKYLVESTKEYPISVNGKLRATIIIDLNATQETVEKIVLANEVVQKWLSGSQPKRIIYVKGKMVNVVV